MGKRVYYPLNLAELSLKSIQKCGIGINPFWGPFICRALKTNPKGLQQPVFYAEHRRLGVPFLKGAYSKEYGCPPAVF
jgi:hypothetical protein